MITAINHLRPVNGGDVVEISGVGGNDGANGNWDALAANDADVDTLYLIGAHRGLHIRRHDCRFAVF
jgi:hypothetical protein